MRLQSNTLCSTLLHFMSSCVAFALRSAPKRSALLDARRNADHDGDMANFTGARERFLVRTARHVLSNAENGVEVNDSWVEQQLAVVGASRADYDRVYALLEANPVAHVETDSTADLSTAEVEDLALAAVRRERGAAARTNDLLADLAARPDADWAALAALAGIPQDALRTRAGRDPESAYSAAGYVTISEAAAMLGVARSTIHRKIRDGKTQTVEVRGRHMIALDEKGVPIV